MERVGAAIGCQSGTSFSRSRAWRSVSSSSCCQVRPRRFLRLLLCFCVCDLGCLLPCLLPGTCLPFREPIFEAFRLGRQASSYCQFLCT